MRFKSLEFVEYIFKCKKKKGSCLKYHNLYFNIFIDSIRVY